MAKIIKILILIAFLIGNRSSSQINVKFTNLNESIVANLGKHKKWLIDRVDAIIKDYKINFAPITLEITYDETDKQLYYKYHFTFHSNQKYVRNYNMEALHISGVEFTNPGLYRELALMVPKFNYRLTIENSYWALNGISYESVFQFLKPNGDCVVFGVTGSLDNSDIYIFRNNRKDIVKMLCTTITPGFPLGTENEIDDITGKKKKSIVLLRRFFNLN
jgi:hypothetical protein